MTLQMSYAFCSMRLGILVRANMSLTCFHGLVLVDVQPEVRGAVGLDRAHRLHVGTAGSAAEVAEADGRGVEGAEQVRELVSGESDGDVGHWSYPFEVVAR